MSSIDKLAIRGIRSFDSQSMAVMQFYSPLTVIVGQNGSGKTTIIECLKYITTGELPPNCKVGGSFVHDPSIAGESSVMAEVLLRFKNAAGTKLVASRRLQVTKNRNGNITMKTLEGTLSYHDDGGGGPNNKRRTISTKCAEMDAELPRHLGISKPILENVIFCHQESSNWPLSEPATLKKRFDDIFEATKYTKALDNIKTIKKEATAELKVDKEKYSALVIDKKRAEKLQVSIDKLVSSVATKEDQYNKLDEKISNLAESNKAFYEGALKYKEILNEHSTLASQKDNKLKIIDDLLEDIDEVQDASDGELIGQREELRSSLASHAQRFAQANAHIRTSEAELAKYRRKHQGKCTEIGQLKAQAQRHLTALEERQDLIVTLSSAHNIDGFGELPIEESRVADFLSTLLASQKRRASDLDSTKRQGKKVEDAKQTETFDLRSHESSCKQNRQVFTDHVTDVRRNIRNVTSQIESVKVSEADIKNQSDRLEEKQEQLLEVKKWFKDNKVDEQVKTKQLELKGLENERDQLHVELSSINKQLDTRAKLALKKGDVSKKRDGIQTLIEAHGEKFKELVQTGMSPDGAEEDVTRVVKNLERSLIDAEASRAAANKETQTVETKLHMNKTKLAKTRRELEALEKHIQISTEGQSLATVIADAESEIHSLLRDLDNMKFSVRFHESLLAKARKANQCAACQRAFQGGEEMLVFERYCKNTIERVPKDQIKREEELNEWEAQLADMKKLLPSEVEATKLRETEVPNLQGEVEELGLKLGEANRKSEEAHSEVEKLKDKLSELQLCKRSAGEISRLHCEVLELEGEVQQLEADLEIAGISKTAQEVQDQLDCFILEISEIRKDIDTLTSEREVKRIEMQTLEKQIHQLELDVNQKLQQLRERTALERQKEELKNEVLDFEAKIQELDEKLKTFRAPLMKLEDELKLIQRENSEREVAMTKELQAYDKSLNQIEIINRELERLSRMGIDTNLTRCQKDIGELESQIREVNEDLTTYQQTLTDLDKESAKAKAFERNINDNIRLRTYRREIKDLEDALAELDVEGAMKASRKYDEEYHKARKYQADLHAEQAKLGGEIGMDKKNLADKKSEMDSEFKNVHQRHRIQLVKVKTIEIANQDLDKYAKALDQAIMKFHSHKMTEINDTIQTLWQKTYQGTDIDNIMIKSENEKARSNRSYNYRVVMMKDQVEMDMRGRCSAGQKVLASIIIRLALAESFGTNCGILALDEPTTNLDRENINALAVALADIIKERRGQANFQLVVITHDEDFLNLLGQSDVLDKYWRVSRNLQQKSIIERQRLV